MLNLKRLITIGLRHYSTSNPRGCLELLKNRTLIRVSGFEASSFLQGLITNDMRHLDENCDSIYAMFLNTKGRVMYDTIVYKAPGDISFLVECDVAAVTPLQKLLKLYKIRKDIEIESMEDLYNVYALFDPETLGKNVSQTDRKGLLMINDVFLYRDPRLPELGSRILAPKEAKIDDILQIFQIEKLKIAKNYRLFRYVLGVGEGVIDLPPGVCFPLEANCDYLHGVSFHKGCYIGQELTARTHHTGVVRKRLMPLFFKEKINHLPPANENITVENVKLGKIRGVEHNVGLALLRVDKVLDMEIPIGKTTAVTSKPLWWPIEAPKEKMNI